MMSKRIKQDVVRRDSREDVERAIEELGIAGEERGMMRLAYELEDQQAWEREATVEIMDWIRIVGAAALLLVAVFLLLVLTFVLAPQAKGDALPDAPRAKVSRLAVALTVANGALAFSDVAYTRAGWGPQAREYDPLARPIVEHGALCYALAGSETIGLAWLGGRMRRSQRWRRVWWMPQAVAVGGHAYALSRSLERNR